MMDATCAKPSKISVDSVTSVRFIGLFSLVRFAFEDRVAAALGPSARSSAATRVLPRRVYFLSAALFSAGALDADFAIDVVGTMM